MNNIGTGVPEPIFGRTKYTREEPVKVFCDPAMLSPKAKRLLGIALAFSLKTGKYPSRQVAATLMRATTESVVFWEQELRKAGLHVSFPSGEDL
jgi:hypothetical protein